MYNAHFGFRELPFSITPDTEFYLGQRSHRDALNTMRLALEHSEGFIKIVGEVGTGKTLLARLLLAGLDDQFVTAYIPNPYLTPEELKVCLAQEVGAEYDKGMASHELMSAIFARLLDLSREGKQVVLIVDEAQAMPRETIEGLRLLTNLETEKRKLLQVVILGQPELDVLLARADLRQLKQRIIFAEYLSPFTRSGVRDYIQHRVKAAGQMARIFSSGSENLVYLATGGIPRLINILCHKALIRAYGRGNPDVTVWHIAEAILDTAECTQPGKIAARFCSLNLLAPAMRAPG